MDAQGRKVIVCDNGTGVSSTESDSERLADLVFFSVSRSTSNVVIAHRISLTMSSPVWSAVP